MCVCVWIPSRHATTLPGLYSNSLAQKPQNQKWDESGMGRDESGMGRDESGMSRDESATGWDESAARAAGYPSRLNDFAT